MWNPFASKRSEDLPKPASPEKVDPAPTQNQPDLPAPPTVEIRNLEISDPKVFNHFYREIDLFRLVASVAKDFDNLKASTPHLADQAEKALIEVVRTLDAAHKIVKYSLPNTKVRDYSCYTLKGYRRACEQAAEAPQTFSSLREKTDNLKAAYSESPEIQKIIATVHEPIHRFIAGCERELSIIKAVSIRDYPEGNIADTEWGIEESGAARFLNDGTGLLFIPNSEVLKINLRGNGAFQHQFEATCGTLPYGITDDSRHVIKQQGMRGCTATVVNMALMDLGFEPDVEDELFKNLGNSDSMLRVLREHGVRTQQVEIPLQRKESDRNEPRSWGISVASEGERADLISKSLKDSHCAIISVDGEVGGHVVILDSFSYEQNLATIRDPYHGWSIDLTAKAVLERINGDMILIEKRSASETMTFLCK